ncbi:uncharacterized protein EMH_0080460 [Eimeria mitis]|uniref:Uncharacterized protein n=1 Tax=Eimeria mitis TaxID=44415 RepID=U6JNI7_9EIME|nr:uncharacterized protein EMH_0080460 [Eimeria mitis]CDJ27074.1 hypothetical protein EMH_0080460 [Eimeria mitis]
MSTATTVKGWSRPPTSPSQIFVLLTDYAEGKPMQIPRELGSNAPAFLHSMEDAFVATGHPPSQCSCSAHRVYRFPRTGDAARYKMDFASCLLTGPIPPADELVYIFLGNLFPYVLCPLADHGDETSHSWGHATDTVASLLGRWRMMLNQAQTMGGLMSIGIFAIGANAIPISETWRQGLPAHNPVDVHCVRRLRLPVVHLAAPFELTLADGGPTVVQQEIRSLSWSSGSERFSDLISAAPLLRELILGDDVAAFAQPSQKHPKRGRRNKVREPIEELNTHIYLVLVWWYLFEYLSAGSYAFSFPSIPCSHTLVLNDEPSP